MCRDHSLSPRESVTKKAVMVEVAVMSVCVCVCVCARARVLGRWQLDKI